MLVEEHIDSDVSDAKQRRCVVTGRVLPSDQLIRFVRAPDGSVVPDLKNRLPGRGVWVSCNGLAVTQAQKRKLFDRGFRAACRIEGDLAQMTGALLEGQAMGYLALANKAGQVVQGFEKVDAALKRGKLAVLIGASDGAEDGRSKMKQRLGAYDVEAAVIEIFASDQLGLALGRTNVIHAGMVAGGLARKFVAAAQIVAAYRSECL